MLRRAIKKQFDKIVYSSPLLNRILRNVNKVLQPLTDFRIRPYGVIRVHYNGLSFKMATNETSFVTKQLFWKGAARFEYTPIFEKLIRNCSSFIDIGANTGYYSLLAATANSSLVAHAFEPASGPFHFLKENTRINGLEERIACHKIALSNEEGEVEFFEIINPSGTLASYNLSGVGGLKKTHETQEQSIRKKVRAERLDVYIKQLNISSIDLVKIDTEGTENMVLQGMSAIIERDKPIIICETLFNKIEAKLEAIMKLHGYLFYNHLNGNLFPVDTIQRRADNGVSDCFFVHPDKKHLVATFIISNIP